MQLLNGKPVLASFNGFLKNFDELVLSENPKITVVADDSRQGKFFAEAVGTGFKINLYGFDVGEDIAASIKGSIGQKDIVLYARASRFAEIGGSPLYQIDGMLAEA